MDFEYHESIDLAAGEDMGYFLTDFSTPGEVKLWRAVLVRAIKDAVGMDCVSRLIQEQAQRWLYRGDKDFKMVCQYAGYDPEQVYYPILDFITAPTPKTQKPINNRRVYKVAA